MRLQKMLLRLQKYTLEVTYKPGEKLFLSHAYLKEQEEELLVATHLQGEVKRVQKRNS